MGTDKPKKISAVIASFNELKTLPVLLRFLTAEDLHEIIVADASDDETARNAAALCPSARFIATKKGRARQFNAGAAAATGDILWFLHADTVPQKGSKEAVLKACRSAAYGGFKKRYNNGSFFMRCYAYLTNKFLHEKLLWLVGTNALFVKREAFTAVGGFPEWRILEDLEFARRLKKSHKGYFITDYQTGVSVRRYRQNGVFKQVVVNGFILLLYVFLRGRSVKIARKIYSPVKNDGNKQFYKEETCLKQPN